MDSIFNVEQFFCKNLILCSLATLKCQNFEIQGVNYRSYENFGINISQNFYISVFNVKKNKFLSCNIAFTMDFC